MDYKKAYIDLYNWVGMTVIQLDEKRLNELSLKNASDSKIDKDYHDARRGAFNEAMIDVKNTLDEATKPLIK